MSRFRLVSALLALLCAACSPEPEAEPVYVAAPVEVRVVPVRQGEIVDWLRIPGETYAARVIRLGSPVAGRITLLDARPGDSLGKGRVAARVLPLETEAALNGYAVLDQAGSLRDEDRRMAKRLADDLQRHDISLPVPFAATVSARQRNPGEQVAAGEVLLELFDPRSLYVVAQAPVDAAPSLRPGMHAEVVLGDTVVAGVIDAVLTAVTPQALTVPVRIALAAPLPHPLLHAAVQCRVALEKHRDALLVPPSALVSTAPSRATAVMVMEGSHASRREVRVGLRTPEAVEILAGLVAGDVVLVDGQYALPDDALVAPQPM